MATMATGHELSVLTNSSVKPPLNPKTGLTTSLHERSAPLKDRLSGIFFDDYDELGQTREEILDTKPKSSLKFGSVTTPEILNLSKVSNDAFYQKLLELKNEQRKILQKCEKMYISKHEGVISPTFPDKKEVEDQRHEQQSKHTLDHAFQPERFYDDSDIVSSRIQQFPGSFKELSVPHERSMQWDSVRDSASKPPSGRHYIPFNAKSHTSPPTRPRSAPNERHITRSLEDLRHTVLGLQPFSDSDDDYIPDDTVSEPYKRRDKQHLLLENMWDNFSIEDYAPKHISERPSSANVTHKEKKIQDEGWRHRLTIPKPFSLTLREEKKAKKKSKSMIEFEQKLLQKHLEEEEECKKKFKARPVPAHVYLPLFDEIQDRSEEKRRQIKQMSAEVLKSLEKPFNFTKRDEDKKLHDHRLNRNCNQDENTQDSQKKTFVSFKAKPVPKYVFDTSINDKILEEEEYRKIRMKMRAEELLRSASLPPSMNAREQMKEQIAREERMRSKRKSKRSIATRPKINHDIPNHDALYKQFQQELQRRKSLKMATVAEPFRLETERTSKSLQAKMKKEIEKEEGSVKENRWPYKMHRTKVKLGHVSKSLDSLPSKSTRSADVKRHKTRNYLQQLTEHELREIEEDRRRRVKELRLRREILEKTKSHQTPIEDPEEKKKKFREAEHARMQEYEQELQEMKERVNKRPLLFEQESQVNAKKKAEKKFNATLKSVGLDEDFVQSRGSRSASVHDHTDDYSDDDFEETPVMGDNETYTKRHDSDTMSSGND